MAGSSISWAVAVGILSKIPLVLSSILPREASITIAQPKNNTFIGNALEAQFKCRLPDGGKGTTIWGVIIDDKARFFLAGEASKSSSTRYWIWINVSNNWDETMGHHLKFVGVIAPPPLSERWCEYNCLYKSWKEISGLQGLTVSNPVDIRIATEQCNQELSEPVLKKEETVCA